MEIKEVIQIINKKIAKIGSEGNGNSMYPIWQDESYADAVNEFAVELRKEINDVLLGENDG